VVITFLTPVRGNGKNQGQFHRGPFLTRSTTPCSCMENLPGAPPGLSPLRGSPNEHGSLTFIPLETWVYRACWGEGLHLFTERRRSPVMRPSGGTPPPFRNLLETGGSRDCSLSPPCFPSRVWTFTRGLMGNQAPSHIGLPKPRPLPGTGLNL